MRETAQNFERFQAGVLEYRLQWNIAPIADIMARLGHPTNEFGNATDVLRVRYIIGHNTAPETEAMTVGGETGHREYMAVDMEIRRMRGENGELLTDRVQVRYLESSDFVPPRYSGTIHPILNSTHYLGDGELGWHTVVPRTDPQLGAPVLFASIDIITNSVRRHRYPPPPQELRRDFHFPDIYLMNVRLDNWGYRGVVANLGAASPWSLFDYIVVDDIPEMAPPPPANLDVSAGPLPPSTDQPFLDVNFAIPSGALMAYLDTQYPMETQITSNLYIGQFEDAVMDTFFPRPGADGVRQPLAPELRDINTYSIDFFDPRLGVAVDGGRRIELVDDRVEIDLSDAVIQSILRGAVNPEDPLSPSGPASGVVRITGIPIVNTSFFSVSRAAIATTASFVAGEIVNFERGLDPEYPPVTMRDMERSFIGTEAILSRSGDFAQRLRLTGVEENTAFFLFSDLEIEKWVEDENNSGVFVLREDIPPSSPNPAISDLTGVVTDTTVGTPQIPGPGEIAPPAPLNIGVRDIEQMGATIFWEHRMGNDSRAGRREAYEYSNESSQPEFYGNFQRADNRAET
jgi:hypothetical protein